ncbi:MAG: lytic transglycosylase domain-containing protein [Thermoanaerobaculia bacterium]|nr:lytic transglycosylase domain-containing protein [Thermoanaerobaculia bacterium]
MESYPGVAGAANAARQNDFTETLNSLLERDADDPRALLLAGLHSRAAGRYPAVCDRLDEIPVAFLATRQGLDDWRLDALARCRWKRSGPAAALPLFERLVDTAPRSPLAPGAAIAALETALASSDSAAARRWLATARRINIDRDPDAHEHLDRLAWDHAISLERPGLLRAAGRTLLVERPRLAEELEVGRALGAVDNSLPAWLSSQERERRAEVLVRTGRPREALKTLDTVDVGDREPSWHLQRAQALTRSGRPADALDYLAEVSSQGVFDASDHWLRDEACALAQSAWQAANPSERRRSPPRARRDELRQAALDQARRCAELTSDPQDAADGWEDLLEFAEAIDDHAAIERARSQLSLLVPEHPALSNSWWLEGWKQYQAGEAAAALSSWDHLDPTPWSSWRHRAAKYWSAEAHRDLGHEELAQSALRELVLETPVTDFYARHALATLGAAKALRTPPTPEEWPTDPTLDRARLLVDLGLEPLAELEIDELSRVADPRTVNALRALSLANRGRLRESILPLIRAFPELGTAGQSTAPEQAMDLYYPLDHLAVVQEWADLRGLETDLVLALIRQESAFDTRALSRSGARGLMQLMPATARELAQAESLPLALDDLHRPETNIRLATRYLRQVLDMFDGDVELALAGYNSGPYRIRRWWKEAGPSRRVDRFIEGLPLEEPRVYVKRILLLSDTYQLRREARIAGKLDPGSNP